MLQGALIWFYCKFAALVSDRMDQIADFAYSTLWYRFPVQCQKPVQTIIQQSNVKFVYTGLGIVMCNMQTLKTVHPSNTSICLPCYLIFPLELFQIVSSVVSYYLLLKSF